MTNNERHVNKCFHLLQKFVAKRKFDNEHTRAYLDCFHRYGQRNFNDIMFMLQDCKIIADEDLILPEETNVLNKKEYTEVR